ncbi:50S ribosomal protein L17 [Candidatus Roizmanbacteria bacterium RIFOXYB2_FULL_38_10]|uniref:50S ribosomal protein L17 n=1 Tax=Candidatus Roizmanbacteria bacterium RIFOXYD1_FULL_38_12 TaxID=1802093 RepID=A0A1F7KZT5_9BACT|nr:MAG: 50S ribosomal protein L17 [Candidatus Roizmanbacteria bacterium RIFOXYA2_FULL_38_14]OGK63412.1 MAG: 50S ribosomal protein L17 [Candidatus Roizmanbacteria bacterium RIFOXYA1_FULL_37_12]OGK65258.1 MAG: 50S ribosomal protein L17 [Candidatus Roizmanbacteria bacterium RIFOXYB1_FULL_40_23]OGK68811.1 MAG: 50S ribosomal protein L17 [Candidatus Roizmanbacteria bacterium RIFOXYB2_FULL_38_10]OGK69663.1 MAG: 50S ribosomal protein L17 [Candidatus Roizmanbacteria bacterium RIFOXYC1_FULL_38_14]OGK728
MKNRGHKIKFRGGKDANKMLMRKLATNFLLKGKMETTKQKAKAAQSIVEKLVTKAKTNSEADRNFMLKHVTIQSMVKILVSQIAPSLTKVSSGYTRIVSMGQRGTDGAQIARLEWVYPVVLETEKKIVEKKQSPKKEVIEKEANKS